MASFGLFDEGSGEPVVMIHSSAASGKQWRRLRETLPRGYRALGVDLWGYGESPLPENGDGFSLEDEADLVATLFDRFEGPCRIVAHSYGGAVAFKLALKHPERVRSLFAYEPSLFHLLEQQQAVEERDEVLGVSKRIQQKLEEGEPEQAAEGFIRYWAGDEAWDEMPPERRQRLAALAPKAELDFMALWGERTPLEAFGALPAPVRIAAGSHSPRPARKVAELLNSALPGALEVLLGLRHMAPLTHPEAVHGSLFRHWEETS